MIVTGRALGGNKMIVNWAGRPKGLHEVWDTLMISKRVNDDFGGNYTNYLNYLMQKINHEWKDEVDLWKTCPGEESTHICPEFWALELNKLNCQTVWVFEGSDQFDASNDDDENGDISFKEDLSKDYYKRNIDVLEILIAKGGVRLGNMVNVFAEN